ncbi:unnamed protein product [Allacma fusca]|uniref:Uncharacterized protein n=1 Tax=Allacma fusca TaxID=39272 RepID=A0A8J2J998_9HEXA|nr:unnamed protein product [Allacma fusca]
METERILYCKPIVQFTLHSLIIHTVLDGDSKSIILTRNSTVDHLVSQWINVSEVHCYWLTGRRICSVSMTDQIVNEWMTEWKNLDVGKAGSFGVSILANEDLFQAVTHVLDENDRFRPLYDEVISTLFAMYRSSEKKLKLFAAQFIPSLIYIYLHQLHSQKKCVTLETLIRGIFELENASDDRPPISVRLPNIHLPSIYHEPGGVSSSWLSDSDLDRLNAKTIKVINRPNLVLTEERIRAPQRLPLCTEVWWYFNHRLPELPKHAVPTYLKTISKLVTQGFTLGGPQRGQPPIRIVLSSKLLIETVATIYYAVYNGAPTLAEQALEEVSFRANYQLWPDAMVVCNAIKNYLKSSGVHNRYRELHLPARIEDVLALGQNQKRYETRPLSTDFVHSRSIKLPLQVEVNTFKKTIITNASFRTKKLPDDIPIVEKETIPEEVASGAGEGPTITITKSLSKLPHILSKIKRNSVVVINEEGDVETMTMSTPPERKKSVDTNATAV